MRVIQLYTYQKGAVLPVIYLEKSFFTRLNAKAGENFKRSIVIMNACHSYALNDAFSNAGLYFGYDYSSLVEWQATLSYYLLLYMINGYSEPVMISDEMYKPELVTGDHPYPSDVPLSAQEAYNILDTYYKVTSYSRDGHTVHLLYNSNDDKQIYFPASAQIVIHKK